MSVSRSETSSLDAAALHVRHRLSRPDLAAMVLFATRCFCELHRKFGNAMSVHYPRATAQDFYLWSSTSGIPDAPLGRREGSSEGPKLAGPVPSCGTLQSGLGRAKGRTRPALQHPLLETTQACRGCCSEQEAARTKRRSAPAAAATIAAATAIAFEGLETGAASRWHQLAYQVVLAWWAALWFELFACLEYRA